MHLDDNSSPAAVESAYKLLRDSVIEFEGQPVGTLAALHSDLPAENYQECFVRDFVPSALVFLLDGEFDIVRNFLRTVLLLTEQQHRIAGHDVVPGVMPASFKIAQRERGKVELVADFGDRAIGRVAPVDSILWWVGLLKRYVQLSGDMELAREPVFQRGLREILDLFLKDTFEVFPTLLTPDGCFMIDRRMGVYGHPLELQALFYEMLRSMPLLLAPTEENKHALALAEKRAAVLRKHVRDHYWLDVKRLNDIHRYKTEEFGHDITNLFNIFPESIPTWIADWFPDKGGYLAGNIGPGRVDFRFFALGNLSAVFLNVASAEQSKRIFELYEARWADLVGFMPIKICFPALERHEWELITGCDSKNVPWSYHNGGNWPCLLWPFTAAALRAGRKDLAQRAFDIACQRLPEDRWPEYYDGKSGRFIGRRASFDQVWSASALILSHKLLQDPSRLEGIFDEEEESQG